jgi:hypothetical protein
LVTGKTEHHFIKDLTPFEYDLEHTNLKDVANRDYQITEVETILQHRGFAKKKSQMSFLVKWKDHDDTYNSWVGWNLLKSSTLLHDYLFTNNLRTAIPTEYQPLTRLRNSDSG